jgi:lactate permease
MDWTQTIDPLNNLALSALIAVLPIVFIFWALIIRKMKGYLASLLSTAIALLIAIMVYGMPAKLALLSTLNGALYGLFPICWIILSAVFLFNITVKSGQFEVIRHFMASLTSDRRIQALLIAFSFGSFLEGTAGFGAPVAITAAMLVGLGFNPLYAAGHLPDSQYRTGGIRGDRHSYNGGLAGHRYPRDGHFENGWKNTAFLIAGAALLPCVIDGRI